MQSCQASNHVVIGLVEYNHIVWCEENLRMFRKPAPEPNQPSNTPSTNARTEQTSTATKTKLRKYVKKNKPDEKNQPKITGFTTKNQKTVKM